MKLNEIKFKYWHLAILSGMLSVVLYKLLQAFPNVIDEFLIAFIVVIIILLLNPVRRFYRAFGALLTMFSSLLIIPAFDFTGVINTEDTGKIEKSLYKLIVEEPHWTIYLVLGILMTVTLILDFFERKKDESRSNESSKEKIEYGLVYDINKAKDFKDWDIYKVRDPETFGNSGYVNDEVQYYKSSEGLGFALSADGKSITGINKSLNFLKGKIEFEYNIGRINNTQDNLILYAIPMKNNRHNKYGYIEVGTDTQSHSENQFSPFRQKKLLHGEGDSLWIWSELEFDFSNTPDAFYSVFAPRINEGCPRPNSGTFALRNIKIYKYNST